MSYFSPAELQALAQAGVTPPVVTEQMVSYCRLHYALMFASTAYSICSLLLILQVGISQRLTAFAQRLTKNKMMQLVCFCLLLFAVLAVIRLPSSWYVGYHIDHAYGLSHQPFTSWLSDLLKSKIVDALVSTLCFAIAFAVIERFPKRWAIVLWGALLPLIAAGVFVAPLVIDPLFNKFSIMAPSALQQSIKQIAARSGISDAPIFVVDKSRQTSKVNAYVTGLGATNRIVIWDNTIAKLPADEVEAVVAHEAGHYVLGHISVGFALIAGGLFAMFFVVAKFSPVLLTKLPKRWQVTTMTSLNAIPVILLFGVVGNFLFAPIENGVSRAMEHQADEFGLRVTGNNSAMARTFVTLSQENLSEPEPPPLIKFWFFSHPSLRERILFAIAH